MQLCRTETFLEGLAGVELRKKQCRDSVSTSMLRHHYTNYYTLTVKMLHPQISLYSVAHFCWRRGDTYGTDMLAISIIKLHCVFGVPTQQNNNCMM